ncbi:(2Fe-2S)-binding protein [candidate division KSB1 bacterium]|nr:(2Fe-2S)-binding protein [candidate division KSB1 bacterium]
MSAEVSHTVEFVNERTLEIQPGQTLLETSLDAGLPHYHVCGGNARCSTCRVLVESGSEFLTPPTPAELALSAKMGFPPKVRLHR